VKASHGLKSYFVWPRHRPAYRPAIRVIAPSYGSHHREATNSLAWEQAEVLRTPPGGRAGRLEAASRIGDLDAPPDLALAFFALVGLGYAADQTILGKQVLVTDPKPGVDPTPKTGDYSFSIFS
jgi:hypothetical protein